VRNRTQASRRSSGSRRALDHAATGQPLARLAGCAGSGTVRRLANGAELARLTPTIPAHALPRHTHDEAHIVFLLRGKYITSAAGGPSACPEGTLIYNPPGTTHRDRFHELDGEFVTMKIPESLRLQWGSGLDQGARHAGRTAQALASGIVATMASWQSDDVALAEILLGEMLAEIDGAAPVVRHWPAWLRIAETRLHDLHHAAPDMDQLAAACAVHPVHLARVFRLRHGCTPVAYSRTLRLERAAMRLRQGNESIAEIAAAFGFSDQSHFHRLFKRAHGCAPSMYRGAR
jgi:AraC family transcriptional regulator